MIVITLMFLGFSVYEWNFLRQRNRKLKTKWIIAGAYLFAYVYVMIVFAYKALPSPNKLIEFVFMH
ncbi:hypothetical protein [Paenibacillus sp. N3.4]|uniref:hypothetical protein n=1 Tax=Paenibacillus sp. N3.4 TaxID=2603222 RepID=UPI0011C90BA7|nr:hypothetical protein [Paenibacillus sp. N3.4]TXK83686.1 hypothetical protein FU659_12225 [Paenibacillus sp. N3.4]